MITIKIWLILLSLMPWKMQVKHALCKSVIVKKLGALFHCFSTNILGVGRLFIQPTGLTKLTLNVFCCLILHFRELQYKTLYNNSQTSRERLQEWGSYSLDAHNSSQKTSERNIRVYCLCKIAPPSDRIHDLWYAYFLQGLLSELQMNEPVSEWCTAIKC